MEKKIIAKYLKPIWTQSYNYGNGIVIGNKLLTAAHVLKDSDCFYIGNQKYNLDDAIVNQCDTIRTDGLYYDFAVFETQEYNHDLELAIDLPLIGDGLTSYSYKHIVIKVEGSGIFAQIKETEELHISKAIVREIIGNFIVCEMSEPLEKGRSGSPLIKDGKVYGILHGGHAGNPCVFLSSQAINQLMSH